MPETAISGLITQGGFAVLAGLAIIVIFQIARMWVSDIKNSNERERALTNRVLDLVSKYTEAITANTAQLAGMETEMAGMRAGLHSLRNAHQVVMILANALTDDAGRIKLEMLGKED